VQARPSGTQTSNAIDANAIHRCEWKEARGGCLRASSPFNLFVVVSVCGFAFAYRKLT
jgi:hypothetical protein